MQPNGLDVADAGNDELFSEFTDGENVLRGSDGEDATSGSSYTGVEIEKIEWGPILARESNHKINTLNASKAARPSLRVCMLQMLLYFKSVSLRYPYNKPWKRQFRLSTLQKSRI